MQIIVLLLVIGAALALIWLAAFGYGWHMNAVYNTKYDLPTLNQVFTILAAQITGLIANHSIFNTEIPFVTQWLCRKTGLTVPMAENTTKEDVKK